MATVGIGSSVPRVEDWRLLTGRGQFVDDFVRSHQAHGVVLYSPHAHARILGIDVSAAAEAPGVIAVLTAAEAAADGLGRFVCGMNLDFSPRHFKTQQPVLAVDTVRHVGDRVAFVVAETQAQSRDAVELIEVDYEALPALGTIEAAIAPGAAALWPGAPDNVSFTIAAGDKAAADAAFARAAHVVRLRLVNNRVSANPMEPRVALGLWEAADRRYTLYTSTQHPHATRAILANDILHHPETALRVVAREVGGGFGMKAEVYPEEALVLWAARRTGRPVKWAATRTESLGGDNHARDQVAEAEMALDAEGHILGVRTLTHFNVGAYLSSSGPVPLISMGRMLPGVYRLGAGYFASKAVLTNATPTGVYRGAGQPEAAYVIDRLIEQAAAELGLDPVAIRRRNYVTADAMPFTSVAGTTYDSGDFPEATRRCLELADWDGFAARQDESRRRGLLRGRALASYIEVNGALNDRMEIRFDPDGSVTIFAGTFSHGQGHETTYAQMVQTWLGVPLAQIKFLQGDTERVAFGRGTYAARSGMVGGSALLNAARRIIAKARIMAAHLLEAAEADLEFAAGRFSVAGTDRAVALVDIVRASYAPVGLPDGYDVGLEAVGTYQPTAQNYPNGSHVCEIEVDPETGLAAICRYVAVADVGTIVNPMIVDGQIHGGLAQGIGQALMELVAYDPESGQLLSGSFTDYAMPRATDFPMFTVAYHEIPCRTNPLGIKGAGEAGTVGAPPTVIGALLDALRPLGVAHIDMPATPFAIWQAIRRASPDGTAGRAAGS